MPTNVFFPPPEDQFPTADSHKWKHMGGSQKHKTSVDIIECYSVTLFANAALAIGLFLLHVNNTQAAEIVSFCMLLFPLAYAFTRGKPLLLALTCILILLAGLAGLFTLSITFFLDFYIAFLCLGLLVALAVRIDGK